MRYRFARQQWARNLMVYTRSSDLTRLKNLLDDGGDHHTVFKLIYNDLQASSVAAAPACCQGIKMQMRASGWGRTCCFSLRAWLLLFRLVQWQRGGQGTCGNIHVSCFARSSLGRYPITKVSLLWMSGEGVSSNAAASAMHRWH